MKVKLHVTLLISFLFISILAAAQQQKDTLSETSNLLFPQFTDGVITMKDGSEVSCKFNYNTLLDEMQFISPQNVILAIANPEKVLKVVIANRTFIFMKNYFVELLADGNVSLFYRVHLKRFVVKIGAYGGTSAATFAGTIATYQTPDGNVNKLSTNEEVSYKNELTYYIMQNGKFKILFKLNDLLKCFPSSKELIQQELEKLHTGFADVESMRKIIVWINAKGLKN